MNSVAGGETQQRASSYDQALDGGVVSYFLVQVIRSWKFILGMTFGAAVLAVAAVLLIPSKYTSEAVILPPAQNSSPGSALLSQLGGAGALSSVAGMGLGLKSPGALYVSLLRSRTVEDAVIRRFGLLGRYHKTEMGRARTEFEKDTQVILGQKDGFIAVSATDHDPKFAAELANGYVDEMKKFSATMALTEAAQRRVFFQQQLQEANESLAAAEEAMTKTEQTTGVMQMDSQTRTLVESAATLRAHVMAKEVQIEGMRAYATDENPELKANEQELSAMREQLSQLASTDRDTGMLIAKGKVPEVGMEYVRRMRDMKYYEVVSELLAKQLEMAKLDEARQGTSIQIVDEAVPAERRSYPKGGNTVMMATLLGFLTATGWKMFSERIKSFFAAIRANIRVRPA